MAKKHAILYGECNGNCKHTDRRVEIVRQLRFRGNTYQQISDLLRIPVSTAWNLHNLRCGSEKQVRLNGQ